MPDLFKGGGLDMSVTPVPHEAASLAWGDCMVNRIAVIVVMILFILEVADLIRLFPYLLRCMSRWKGNLELEHSVSLARTRNTVSFVTALVLCLIVDCWILDFPSFKTSLPVEWQLAYTGGLILGYVILRRLLYVIFPFRSRINEYDSCLQHCVYNYQILLTCLMMVTVLPLAALKVPADIARNILLIETAVFTALHFLRSGQIFSSRCSNLLAFLYLCALEILPLGILYFACTI